MKLEYKLENLNCANCAAKISDRVSKLDGVSEVNLNFPMRTLSLVSEKGEDTLYSEITGIVNRTEEGVTLQRLDGASKEKKSDNSEYIRDGIRIGAAAVLCLISMLPAFATAAKMIIVAAAVLIAGYDILWAAVKNVLRLNIDEKVLLAVAVIAAFAISEYYEAAAVMVLFSLGEIFEDISSRRSQREIEALADIRPDRATVVLADGRLEEREAKDVGVGEIISVSPYERIPLDGRIIEGSTTLDTSALTGESLPQNAAEGAEVMSGMLNCGGLVKIEVTKSYSQSAASRIIEMVKEAAANKGSTDRFITKFARVYTPIVIIAAVLMCSIPTFIYGEFTTWLYRALVLLVASCPCALVISVPLGFFSAVGAASKSGILIKGGRYVEVLAKARAVVFDKTGTLTTGCLSVKSVTACEGYSEEDILKYAAAADKYSSHPAAKAIINEFESRGGEVLEGEAYNEAPGYGVYAEIEGKAILCGSFKWMDKNGCDVTALPASSIYVAADGTAMGCIEIADTVRQEAKSAVSELKELGISSVSMLSGDNEEVCADVAAKCGFDSFAASLLPENKVERLEGIKSEFGATVFVGDGINDAPVLSAADVGAAMGLGSDAALQSADMVLVSDSPDQLPTAIGICRRAMGVIRFNIDFALTVKLLVFLLVPFGLADMWMAVVADVGVSILSILNAMRILKFGKNK